MANAEVFDSFFRRADLDKDGRISGQEAVGFFQGAGLPQMTLAKIWQFADQGRTGFLSPAEFSNALKLVTVAQTGREITPELVRAALTGPAAAQIPPPRISGPAGQAGGGSAAAAAASSQGPVPVRGAGPAGPAGAGAASNGQEAQARGVQGSNGVASGRGAGVQGNGSMGSQGPYGGAPGKQFSPHTNSAPGAAAAQGAYGGGPAKQLGPQASSVSAGGSGGPQLTTQTSSLSRYPPSAGQVQVAPTGFSQQQGWARPPAAGAPPARPSLGSLFTTNSAWPGKEANPPAGASQAAGSGGGSTGPSPAMTTPSSGQSRPVTPGSSASVASSGNAGGGTTAAGQGPAAAAGPSSTKEGQAGAAFGGAMDLFSGGFKATGTSGAGSGAAGSGAGVGTFPGSQGAKAGSVPAPGQSKLGGSGGGGSGGVKQLEESMFSGPAVPSVQMAAQGGGRGPGGGGVIPQGGGPLGSEAMGMGPGSGARPQGGPVAGAPWPQMSGNDVERYSRVFAKVDTDKDGKITGEQARELFLSWQLPRGVLKQVWDLSDQDHDSMLSLREFCTALYFMERFREGRALPGALPAGIHPGSLQGAAGQGPGGQSGPVWRHVTGGPQAAAGGTATVPGAAVAAAQFQPLQMPERGVPAPGQTGGGAAAEEGYKSKVPALEGDLVDQLSRDEQEMLKTKHKAAEEADKKVYELDREIQDYKEKIELYRAKLQEIILFKSRCDNQLDEVKERVGSERRETEALGKKYDQRFKAAGEVSSRLQAEEAAFRDIQEKKMELYTAIAKLDKGGDGEESVEKRANHLSANLDDLKKSLYERGRALGVRPKSAVPIEVSTGFEGVPDNAMEWVEDWDRFDDEGFTNVRDIMDDLGDEVPSSTKGGHSAAWGNGESLFDDGFDFSSDPTLPGDPFKAGHDEEPFSASDRGRGGFGAAGDSEDAKRGLEGGGEHDVSPSDSRHKDYAFNASLPSARFSGGFDSEAEGGGDAFRGEAAFDSGNDSFGRGRSGFDSRDPFGESASAWGFQDEDANADFRGSWGQGGSGGLSTQTSMELSSARGQTRFGRERVSVDMDALRVSSPRGALFDGSIRISSPGGFDSSRRESSPGAGGFGGLGSPGWNFDRNGNGHDDYRSAFAALDSPKSNAFGSPRHTFGSPRESKNSSSSFFGNSSYDAAPSLFGGSPGGSRRDGPARDGGSFMRFDSFGPGSAGTAGRGLGGSEEVNGAGHGGERSLQRFDSSNSMKPERERRRGFGSDDDSDPFGSSGPFGGGAQTAKQSNVWSAF